MNETCCAFLRVARRSWRRRRKFVWCTHTTADGGRREENCCWWWRIVGVKNRWKIRNEKTSSASALKRLRRVNEWEAENSTRAKFFFWLPHDFHVLVFRLVRSMEKCCSTVFPPFIRKTVDNFPSFDLKTDGISAEFMLTWTNLSGFENFMTFSSRLNFYWLSCSFFRSSNKNSRLSSQSFIEITHIFARTQFFHFFPANRKNPHNFVVHSRSLAVATLSRTFSHKIDENLEKLWLEPIDSLTHEIVKRIINV